MGFFTGGEPRQKKGKTLDAGITDETATIALERSRRLSSGPLFDWADTAIMDLHEALDAFRFRGGPPEEVERCLTVASVLCREAISRELPPST